MLFVQTKCLLSPWADTLPSCDLKQPMPLHKHAFLSPSCCRTAQLSCREISFDVLSLYLHRNVNMHCCGFHSRTGLFNLCVWGVGVQPLWPGDFLTHLLWMFPPVCTSYNGKPASSLFSGYLSLVWDYKWYLSYAGKKFMIDWRTLTSYMQGRKRISQKWCSASYRPLADRDKQQILLKAVVALRSVW